MISAENCAKLILANMAIYNKNNDKNLKSFLISKQTIRILADRLRTYDSFLESLRENLLELGYIFIDFGDESKDKKYSIISLDKFYNMKKLSSKYVRNYIEEIDDQDDIDEVFNEFFCINNNDEDIEEDEEE